MRNTAFVVVGLLFLIIQANVFRLLQVVGAMSGVFTPRRIPRVGVYERKEMAC